MPAISVENITKKYGKKNEKVLAVDDLSFSVKEGEIFGLIGPDGSGKTTVFRILTTLLLPDSGMAKVLDFDIEKDYKQIRKIVGYMPGKFSLYQDLSVEENLQFFASVFNTRIAGPSAAAIISLVDVFPFDPVTAITGTANRRR